MPVQYPYLPPGREIKFVPYDDPFMTAAREVCARLSTDHARPTGAVAVRDGRVLIEAANQAALPWPWLRRLHKKHCIRRIFGIPSGQKYWLCPGCATNRQHAESRVAHEARRRGIDITGADVYLWGHWWACQPCWDAILAAGVRDLYVVENAHERPDCGGTPLSA